ncbi:hypothetical protein F5Y03DRAFT_343339 [Xylaria venustula]|nr:hypothetical protein F5Y03DRAFT_343339 [Xylaria venustula]
MRTILAILTCAAVAHAATIASRSYPPPPGPWTAGVWRYPAPYYYGDGINANNGFFWLGKEPTAYCPTSDVDCSAYPGTSTIFVGGNDTVSLLVGVGGGQQVYIDANGALAYAQPNATLPEGAVINGFERAISEAFGAPTVLAFPSRNWQLCSVNGSDDGVYQIFLGNYTGDCLLFEMRTYTASGASAWEYV